MCINERSWEVRLQLNNNITSNTCTMSCLTSQHANPKKVETVQYDNHDVNTCK